MESIIDIQLVKQQLKLLGHDVADSVILQFVKGLGVNKGSGSTAAASNQTTAMDESANSDAAVRDTRTPAMPINSQVDTLGSSKETGRQAASKQPSDRAAAWVRNSETDAAPSKMQQVPDQQSPKRLPVSGSAGHEQDSPPAHNMLQRAALDQRCRNFLSRCSDKPALQQQQQQEPLAQQPILLQVPHLQDKAASTHSSSQVSSAASSELNLGDAGADTDSSEGSMHNLGLQQSSARRLLGHTNTQQFPAAADWAQRPQQQGMHAQLGAEIAGADNSSETDSEGSSIGLEAEGSKFLLHQAATMQRVRARLAAKMAGYTAAAANAAHTTSAVTAAGAQKVSGSAGAAAGSAAAAPAVASTGTASNSGATSSSTDSAAAAQSAAADSNELPRFGFRPGYKPVGIHMPPPPSAAAVEALAAARTLRQQATAARAGSAPAAAKSSSQKGVSVPPLKLDAHMQSLASAVNSLHDHQQAVQQLPTSAGMGSSSLHLVASPGKAACASAVAGARASGSIIAGDTPPCMSAAGHRTRQSPRVDPLYLAPSSPRRSNPATPRSSPALSPVPLAPLSAAAVGLGLMRSPAGTAPAAAMGAARSASSNGSRQCLSFSANSRAAAGRSSAQQQQQRDSTGSTMRVASAPPTPSAVAPSAAHRGMTPGAGSGSTSGSYSARRSSVSHESLYCQRLAYSSQRSTVAPGVRKTDRVARFQQMQQQWSKDRFLSSGGGGAAAKKTAGQQ